MINGLREVGQKEEEEGSDRMNGKFRCFQPFTDTIKIKITEKPCVAVGCMVILLSPSGSASRTCRSDVPLKYLYQARPAFIHRALTRRLFGHYVSE